MCSIPECHRTGKMRAGLCNMHYQRSKTGLPMVAGSLRKEKPRREGICQADGCESPMCTKGYCGLHYRRWAKHGDPTVVLPAGTAPSKPMPGASNGFWRGEDVTYTGMHARVRRNKGRAVEFRCVICSAPATEWAYNNADPNEKTEVIKGSECAYSTDLEYYIPTCATCHRRFDRAVRSMI